jgi:hypothetical protein
MARMFAAGWCVYMTVAFLGFAVRAGRNDLPERPALFMILIGCTLGYGISVLLLGFSSSIMAFLDQQNQKHQN